MLKENGNVTRIILSRFSNPRFIKKGERHVAEPLERVLVTECFQLLYLYHSEQFGDLTILSWTPIKCFVHFAGAAFFKSRGGKGNSFNEFKK